MDASGHVALARATASLSPASMLLAWLDWVMLLVASPGKCESVRQLALAEAGELAHQARTSVTGAAAATARGGAAPPADRRFTNDAWRQWPFSLWQASLLSGQRWWTDAKHGVRGEDPHHAGRGRLLRPAVAGHALA
jgi:polyhydroxyalkanoate synthase